MLYSESKRLNIKCAKAIKTAVRKNYVDSCLKLDTSKEIIVLVLVRCVMLIFSYREF